MGDEAQRVWSEVDRYFSELLVKSDATLDAVLEENRKADLPAIDVTALQGKFLELLVRISGARKILEIGTLGGYSTIWLAHGMLEGGSVVTLELEPHHAEVAELNLRRAGLMDRVDLRVGRAVDSLKDLETEGAGPFDLIFIDADKSGYPEYLSWALKLSRAGTVIVADNVVRDGKVIDLDSADPSIQGVRRFTELVGAEPRLNATVLQTVGSKGSDGFAVATVVR